ncbi:MAG: UDP-N-acetylglucosamine 1-carboxyvinyltransferase [Minisyncoccia bacterium]
MQEKEKFIVYGEKKLTGEIEVLGSKNAAGPILAATILTKKDCVISNLPHILDILLFLDILKEMGTDVIWLDERTVKINTKNLDPEKIDYKKVEKIRLSVLLIGALLTRFEKIKISKPGGDRIGVRPITTHLEAMKKLGINVQEDGEFYYFERKKIKPGKIVLTELSVTATENLLLLSSLANGKTIIKCGAIEPHVVFLANFLKKMGVNVKILHDHTFEIEGKKDLKGGDIKIIPDYIEAATFVILGSLLGEKLKIKNIVFEHLEIFFEILKRIGINFEKEKNCVIFNKQNKPFFSSQIQALPYPGFPTDILPLMIPLLTQSKGKSLIHDPLYENRLGFVQELKKMGADIEIVDPHRVFIFGPTELKGTKINSSDIRAGASLLIAALIAKGKSIIEDINQIDRGYENLESRLQKIGALISRQ